MTVQEYREKTPLTEQKAFAEKLQIWLGYYTQEVYEKVMGNMEEIINNPATLRLIDELYKRTIKERDEEIRQIYFSIGLVGDYGCELHAHALTHSGSYRDVLYDLYIKN